MILTVSEAPIKEALEGEQFQAKHTLNSNAELTWLVAQIYMHHWRFLIVNFRRSTTTGVPIVSHVKNATLFYSKKWVDKITASYLSSSAILAV